MSRAFKSPILLALLFIFLVFSSSSVFAQGIPGVGTPISITTEPSNPKPLETVVIAAKSYSFNIDQADIVWYENGKVIGRGKGLKTMSIKAGALGSSKTIDIVASNRETGEVSGSVTIRPTDLSLVWQAASYTPAFYRGKALVPFGGTYKVVALPEILDAQGKKIDPKTLIYSWRKNDALDQDASGYGKDFFVSSQTSFVREGDEVSVEVTSPIDGFTVSGATTITPISPEIHLYEDNPLYGVISERELNVSMNLASEEVSIVAEPFFFSVNGKTSSLLTYDWTLNSSPVSDFANKSSIILRRSDKSAGSAEIGLTVGNSARLLQGANHSLLIRYE